MTTNEELEKYETRDLHPGEANNLQVVLLNLGFVIGQRLEDFNGFRKRNKAMGTTA